MEREKGKGYAEHEQKEGIGKEGKWERKRKGYGEHEQEEGIGY
jgi:hypothetical protein